ncbi:MAG: YggS family pyridoxal phosphate-dependent enzyme [Lachnospiraceae bacterium]
MLTENLEKVEENIVKACEHSGRKREEITLIAVSKTKPVEMLDEIYQAGIRDFGENKVQELSDKFELLPKDIRWHMIGHLQRNKIKQILGKTKLIHSVDSVRLAEAIEKEAAKLNENVDILVEVNMAKEESKFGLAPEDTMQFIENISLFSHLNIQGLMTIAPYVANPEENRPYFANLHKLYIDIASKKVNNVNMSILSMGMTNDYMVAIEEGATMVRIGTGIFGERYYNID